MRSMLVLLATLGCAAVFAQDLPKEISGRWTWTARGATQVFSLEDIQAQGSGFTAKLTWWTQDSKCTLRGEPITGRVVGQEIAFEARTKCDVAFTATLARSGAEWAGSAKTTNTPQPVLLELKAK